MGEWWQHSWHIEFDKDAVAYECVSEDWGKQGSRWSTIVICVSSGVTVPALNKS